MMTKIEKQFYYYSSNLNYELKRYKNHILYSQKCIFAAVFSGF